MPTNAIRTPRSPGWSVAVVGAVAMTASYVDRQALSHLAPTVRSALNLSHQDYGVIIGVFSLAYLIGTPLAVRIVNGNGARRGLALALIAWSLIAGLHGFAASFATMFLLRLGLGATEASGFPAAARAISRVTPPVERAVGYGLLFTGSSIGAIIAAPVVIGLKIMLGWKLAFAITGALGLLCVPLWLIVSARHRAELKPHAEPRQHAEDIAWNMILSERSVQRAFALVFLSAPAIMFVYGWYAQVLSERLYLDQDDLWKYLWLPPLMFDVGAVAFGSLSTKRNARSSRTDLVFLGAVLVAALAAVPYVDTAPLAIVLAAVSMFGAGGLYVVATTDMLAHVPAPSVLRAGACTSAAQSLAAVIGAPIVGAVLDQSKSYTPVLVGVGLLAIPGALLWAIWPVRRARDDESASEYARS